MTYVLGLTGSIGMGKSTTARMFSDAGIPVWDADAAVHALYAPDGAATRQVLALFPDVRADDGSVSRSALRAKIAADPVILDQLTAIVHPMVAAHRDLFLNEHANLPIVLLDIPLLFENGLESLCNGIVVVTAPASEQRRRLQARAAMTDAEIDMITARQMPDTEKRRRATWVIETISLDQAHADVKDIITQIRGQLADA